MRKDSFYFSHDYTARNDDKIKVLIRKLGFEGYGIFWALVEDLYINANAMRVDCEGIAFDMRTQCDRIEWIIYESGLFVVNDGYFSSNSVCERLNERNDKSAKASQSAQKRWGNANAMRTHTESDATAMQPQANRNAKKEIKGDEIKEIKEIDKGETQKSNFPKSEKLKPFSEIMNADNTKILFSDLEWQNRMMAYGCTSRELSKYLTEFQSDRYANGDQNREVKDIKKYFLNWLKLKIEKQTEKAKKDADKRKDRFNVPIPDYNA